MGTPPAGLPVPFGPQGVLRFPGGNLPHRTAASSRPEALTCEHAPNDGAHASQEVSEGPGRGVGGLSGHPNPFSPPLALPALTCASLLASPSWARAHTARRPQAVPGRPAGHWRPSHVWSQRTDLSSAPGREGSLGRAGQGRGGQVLCYPRRECLVLAATAAPSLATLTPLPAPALGRCCLWGPRDGKQLSVAAATGWT